jgi:hypothetical protein
MKSSGQWRPRAIVLSQYSVEPVFLGRCIVRHLLLHGFCGREQVAQRRAFGKRRGDELVHSTDEAVSCPTPCGSASTWIAGFQQFQRTIRAEAAASASGRMPAQCPAVGGSPWIERVDVHTPDHQLPCIAGLLVRLRWAGSRRNLRACGELA